MPFKRLEHDDAAGWEPEFTIAAARGLRDGVEPGGSAPDLRQVDIDASFYERGAHNPTRQSSLQQPPCLFKHEAAVTGAHQRRQMNSARQIANPLEQCLGMRTAVDYAK